MIMERETDESPQEAFGDDGPPPQQEMSIQPNDHSPIIDASIEYATSIGALPPPQEFRVHETTDDDDEAGSMPALRPDWEKQPSPLLQDEHQAKRCSRESQILILIVALLMLPLGITAAVVVSRRNQNQNQNQLPLDDSSSVGTTSLWKPEERLGEIKAILSTVGVSDPLTFLEPTSPQARALDWLVYEDTLLTPNDAPDVIVQRYVAILFAYAGNAELWRGVEPWFELTGSHECSFPGLDCNPDNNHIDSIQLLRRRVSGTIPEEIGLLTDLKILVLGMNHLEGSFPDSMFQKLTKLRK